MRKFKIDFRDSHSFAFVLCVLRTSWFRSDWHEVASFETREDARKHYEKIKDLPEYL
jgi:hypothetical protein